MTKENLAGALFCLIWGSLLFYMLRSGLKPYMDEKNTVWGNKLELVKALAYTGIVSLVIALVAFLVLGGIISGIANGDLTVGRM